MLPYKTDSLTALARKLVHAVYEYTPLLPESAAALAEALRKAALTAYLSAAAAAHHTTRRRRRPHYREVEEALVRLDAAFELVADMRWTGEGSRSELDELRSTTFTELKKVRKKRGRLQ